MNKVVTFLLSIIILSSCQDNAIIQDEKNPPESEYNQQSGMQRIVASSPEEIKQLISQIGDRTNPLSRSHSTVSLSNNEEPFVSLIEANRQKVMESLTPAQLDSIANDEDELEFCPADSVIADIQFAQLLNAEREIQVGQTVYKYMPNGVAYSDEIYAEELKTIESVTSDIEVTPENVGTPMQVAANVEFIPLQYYDKSQDDMMDKNSGNDFNYAGNYGSGSNSGTVSNEKNDSGSNNAIGMTLSNGVQIPVSDIRDINYYDKGDGNWFHRTWTGLWGRNVVAIKKFSKNKKLTMNFYDQNYIIYANIGTKIKMQKKVCGIWWNIKAEEMILGWETVTVKYQIPQPIPPSTFTYNGMTNPTVSTYHPFPFSDENVLIIHIPFTNYDFTTKDLNKAFKSAAQLAFKQASDWVKEESKSADKIGLTCFNETDAYIIHGPYSTSKKNKRSMESKFYAKWFPGTCQFQFSIGRSVNLKNIKFSKNDEVELYRGIVYGAIKYNGKWLAARITKDSDN